jgi:hypothetical protein
MPKPRRGDNLNKEIVLSNAAIVRIADELERRLLKVLLPEPAPAIDGPKSHHIDQDDLLTPQRAAHLYRVSDQTIYRWIAQFDISECIAGTTLVSRRKIEAHLARRRGRSGS